MALRIAHNIAAMNTHRWLSAADAAMAKNLSRLSSGYRINSGADDAAGLAVSSQFRADIASFQVASRNASEATSMLQVADGALDQVGNILTRLKELATQASSANTSDTNRAKLNSEAGKLILEAERIADSTSYGSNKLIDGTYGVTMAATSNTDGAGVSSVSGMTSGSEVYNFTITAGSDATHWDVQVTTGNGSQTIQDAVATPGAGATTDAYFAAFGITVSFNNSIAATVATVTSSATGSSDFRVGATANDYDKIDISLGDAQTAALGIDSLDLSTASGATTAMATINDAISTLSDRRGAVGAYMNRLMYASANLSTTIENVQGAESTIRDVDMASEMTDFTKNQILTQASTAMLAQANVSAQSILTLFR